MRLEFYFIVFSGLFQMALALFIAFITGKLRDEAQSKIIRFRLKLFEAAFFLYALRTFFHVFLSGSGVSNEVDSISHMLHINLLLGHAFETVFFVLIGTIGLLYFVDNKYHENIKKASLGIIGILALIIIYLSTFYALALFDLISADPLLHSDSHFIFFHSFQVFLILSVSAIILKKLLKTHATLDPFKLHKKYPFGLGVILLTFANLFHLHSLIFTRSVMVVLEIIEETFALIALAIIFLMMRKTFNMEIERFAQGGLVESRDMAVSLNDVLKHAYFGYYKLEIGEKDFMYNKLLESGHLSDVAVEGGIGIDRSRFFEKVSEDPEFPLHVAKGLMEYFEENPQMLDKEQLDRLINYLAISTDRHRRDVPALRTLWITLSNMMEKSELTGSSKMMKLKDWNPSSNFAYFENTHPTGLENLDRITGGITAKSFVLNLRKAGISKQSLFYPFIGINLSRWRTIIYVTPDEPSDIISDLELEKYLDEGRMILVGLTHGKGAGNAGKGLYLIEESSKDLLRLLEELISGYPFRAVIMAIDLNPLILREEPEELYFFVRELKKMIQRGNISIYGTATDKMDSIKLDLIEESSDLVIHHKIEDEVIVSVLAKAEFGKKPLALKKELYDVLVFVEKENAEGRKVNISWIMRYMGITAVTARKRIKELLRKDLLEVEKVGRTKILSISNKGKEFLYTRKKQNNNF